MEEVQVREKTPELDQEIEQMVYDPWGENSARSEEKKEEEKNDAPISLEELQQQEKKSKRPVHTRPLVKMGMVAGILLPAFLFVAWFTEGQSDPRQVAQEAKESGVETMLRAENEQLLEKIDQMEIDLAKVEQEREKQARQQEVKNARKAKPQTQGKPKPPTETTKPQPTVQPERRVTETPEQTVINPEPTAAEKQQKLQALAQSLVVGGGMIPNTSREEKEQTVASASKLLLVNHEAPPAVEKLAIEPELEASLLEEKPRKQFEAGTSLEAILVHPLFFSNSEVAIANLEVKESQTPLPQGTKLVIQLQNSNGILHLNSIEATVGGQTMELDPKNWQIAGEDGSPIIARAISDEKSTKRERQLGRNQTARDVLRNTRGVYRSNDAWTSLLIGAGSTVAERQLENNDRRIINTGNRDTPEIETIAENTRIKMYVIQSFSQIMP